MVFTCDRYVRATAACLVLAAFACGASNARGEDEARRIELGLHVGGAIPFGKVDGQVGDDLNQTVQGALPVGISIGYYVEPRLLLGLYGSYAPAAPASALRSDCSAHGATCSSDDVRVGVQAQIHGGSAKAWDPWVGLGSGYECLRVQASSQQLALEGWEIIRFEAGLDARSHGIAALGPFVSWTIGEYESESAVGQGMAAISGHALHEWLTVGLRGVIDIPTTRTPDPGPTEVDVDGPLAARTDGGWARSQGADGSPSDFEPVGPPVMR
jgi:hypothetical protein